MQAIILAGGKGTRLKPFTTFLPKPLVPIGEVPILEIVLRQLKYYGFTDAVLAVNHLAALIESFFGGGEKIGLKITYSRETKPLGTAAPIALIDKLDKNFLVMNGDLLTTVNFGQLFNTHVKNGNDVTICAAKKKVKIDLGLLHMDQDNKFERYVEKPTLSYWVSSGIYIFNRSVVDLIPRDQYFDMPALMTALKEMGKKVMCYTDDFEWLDIGRVEDYETAVNEFNAKKDLFLPHG